MSVSLTPGDLRAIEMVIENSPLHETGHIRVDKSSFTNRRRSGAFSEYSPLPKVDSDEADAVDYENLLELPTPEQQLSLAATLRK